ncbi:2Fe-2S ferredoxin-type domain-containing protein [Tribonema minus]|uniref:2Fe-2S ferredoxin-type domain-containing protein n=1 Tax=Tribonema minus TaxID=303371 RepID=A0A835Z8W8_9STRA|nr:2Fe-2S ferredoxin-type domain-containing protein [Tribonema minus]
MRAACISVALAGLACQASGFIAAPATRVAGCTQCARASSSALRSVPLELEGKLDPSKSWEVELVLDGETKKVTVPEGTSVLEAAEMVFDDPPFSCRNGVCTTCAGFIEEGRDSHLMAVHGLGRDILATGFTLTCQTYPTGPGLKVALNKYDEVYWEQYGKHEKSELDKRAAGERKVFGLF